MNFQEFLYANQGEVLIDTSNLPAVLENKASLRVQISRWVKSGKLLPLRRGLYVLAEPFRKREADVFYTASVLQRPSYVSLEKALEYFHLIPEAVHVTTSVTTKRPVKFRTALGQYDYYHIRPGHFWGYQSVRSDRQTAFIAHPEKALLDLFYFRHRVVSRDFIAGLRLQNLQRLDIPRLLLFAKKFGKPKIIKAADILVDWIRAELREEKTL